MERALRMSCSCAFGSPPKLVDASLRLQKLLRSKASATQQMQHVDDIWVEQRSGGYTFRVTWRSLCAMKAVWTEQQAAARSAVNCCLFDLGCGNYHTWHHTFDNGSSYTARNDPPGWRRMPCVDLLP
jgi:hypothetical protein